MPLIQCPECNHNVSDSAASCPSCGFGLKRAGETRAAGTPLNTVQMTSKRFKAQQLISFFVFCIGFGLVLASAFAGPGEGSSLGGVGSLMTAAGLIWMIVTRLRIWWHHE